jgi:hypothetical protein
VQWHFEFQDWEKAFELFYRKKKQDKAYCLVISTDSYTSGYWIEKDAKRDEDTRHIYRSVKSAQALESRIRSKQAEFLQTKGFIPLGLGLIV